MFSVGYELYYNNGKTKNNVITAKTKEDAMKFIDVKAQQEKAKTVFINGLTYYVASMEPKFY